ncbi:MAG: hypothetical protein AAF329_01530, partial [Cyanobacteria bacterium P01_A01_bin.17]
MNNQSILDQLREFKAQKSLFSERYSLIQQEPDVPTELSSSTQQPLVRTEVNQNGSLGLASVIQPPSTFRSLGSTQTAAPLSDEALPELVLDPVTQLVTVDDDSPTVSVLWDRAVQLAVINGAPGPTV